jgi:arsenate reductase
LVATAGGESVTAEKIVAGLVRAASGLAGTLPTDHPRRHFAIVGRTSMSDKIFNVLFLCTANSARSIMAESILNIDGKGRFRAFSAGSQPSGAVSPWAIKTLEALGYPSSGLSSKSWDVYGEPDAPHMDFIFTVCDNAAGEACPVWPGHPATAHWGIEDPKAVEGPDLEKARAFAQAARYLKNRISLFVNLPITSIERHVLQSHIEEIGRAEPMAS